MEKRIENIKKILSKQISWYLSNKHDEGLVYDDLLNEFRNLSRGDYVNLIEILINDEKD